MAWSASSCSSTPSTVTHWRSLSSVSLCRLLHAIGGGAAFAAGAATAAVPPTTSAATRTTSGRGSLMDPPCQSAVVTTPPKDRGHYDGSRIGAGGRCEDT